VTLGNLAANGQTHARAFVLAAPVEALKDAEDAFGVYSGQMVNKKFPVYPM